MTLFSNRWKIVGWCCYLLMFLLLAYYFVDGINIKMPVAVIFSSYDGVGWFAIQKTNIADEVLILLYIATVIFILFSKDKDENSVSHFFRLKSLAISFFVLMILIAFDVLFLYGGISLKIAGGLILLFPIIYIVIKALLTRNKNLFLTT